jgi:hypothetical protein
VCDEFFRQGRAPPTQDRALKQAIDLGGAEVFGWVKELENCHLLWPDAIKLAAVVMRDMPWLPVGALPKKLAQRLFLRCHCGRPFAFRPDSKTCGNGFCRLKRPRTPVADLTAKREMQRLRAKFVRRPPMREDPAHCRCREPEPVGDGRRAVRGSCLLPFGDGYHPREVSS